MAAFVKFQKFPLGLGNGRFNFGADQLKVALTNVAPSAANDDEVADLTEIVYTTLSSRNVTTTSWSQTGGIGKLVLADLVLTSTGPTPTFRYAVLFDDTAAGDPLIGYYDYGVGGVTLADTETLTIDFDATAGALTLA